MIKNLGFFITTFQPNTIRSAKLKKNFFKRTGLFVFLNFHLIKMKSHGIFPNSGRVDTAIWMHHMDAN